MPFNVVAITGRPRTARFYMALSGGSEAEFHSKVSPILDGAGLEHYVMSKLSLLPLDVACVLLFFSMEGG